MRFLLLFAALLATCFVGVFGRSKTSAPSQPEHSGAHLAPRYGALHQWGYPYSWGLDLSRDGWGYPYGWGIDTIKYPIPEESPKMVMKEAKRGAFCAARHG
jgi:hypothetical protein